MGPLTPVPNANEIGHNSRVRNVGIIALAVLWCAWSIGGCSSSSLTSPDSEGLTIFDHILVIPFQDVAAVYGTDQTVQGPLSGKVFVTGTVAPKAALFMTSEATRLLSQKMDPGSVIASRNVQPGMLSLSSEHQRHHRINVLSEAGRKAGADAVLIGYVYGFEERVGGDYGADMPAKVSFELNLISVESQRLVWQNRFTETQKALNEDLFQLGKFMRRKGRWITAREMAANALHEMISSAQVF